MKPEHLNILNKKKEDINLLRIGRIGEMRYEIANETRKHRINLLHFLNKQLLTKLTSFLTLDSWLLNLSQALNFIEHIGRCR